MYNYDNLPLPYYYNYRQRILYNKYINLLL